MDGERFDAMTRALSTGASRRRVLRGLAAGAAGALAGALGLRRAGAGVPSANCSAYGRVCTYTGCCRDGAECVCYRNGHCRCLCPAGAEFANGACVGDCPPGDVTVGACTCVEGGSCTDFPRPGCAGQADSVCACQCQVNGGVACVAGGPCDTLQDCGPGGTCPEGTLCMTTSCIPSSKCLPPCAAGSAAAVAPAGAEGDSNGG